MSDTLYINKPGGVIAKLKDGTAHPFSYGDPITQDQVADHVDITKFADTKKRKPDLDEQAREAQLRAAQVTQPGSSASPVPGNYGDLDENGAAVLVGLLADRPQAQAAILIHEALFCGNRQLVRDAAGPVAQALAEVELGQGVHDAIKDPSGDKLEAGVSAVDPQAARTGAGNDAEQVAARAQADAEARLPQTGAKGRGKTPPPSGS